MISESICNDEGFVRDFDWGKASVIRLKEENPTASLHEIGQMFADEVLGKVPEQKEQMIAILESTIEFYQGILLQFRDKS